MGNAVYPEDDSYDRRGGAGLLAGTAGPAGPARLDPPHASALYLGQPASYLGQSAPHLGQSAPHPGRGYPAAQSAGWAALTTTGTSSPSTTLTDLRPVPPVPADRAPRLQPEGQHAIRLPRTWPQRTGGILIAGAMVTSAVWYIPSVLHDNRQLFTGSVASSGVITLNFSTGGVISTIDAKRGAPVKKGEVLAKEYAPDVSSLVDADKAAINADEKKIAQVKEAEVADPANAAVDAAQLAAAQAQDSLDQAQLATDQEKIVATEIIAPSSGVIVAANGLQGQNVTTSGIRDYVADSQQQSAVQGPAFSLLPEGPQTVRRVGVSTSAVPVFALRTSIDWQVIALIPESAVSRVRAGQRVFVSVPSDQVKDVPGQISEILPNPAQTTSGVFYQAVVNITGHSPVVPLNGMTADVEFGS
jgi:multidrug efflux pump subunit AcrA (membrane-fusion protein)